MIASALVVDSQGRAVAREAVPEKNYDALAAAHSRAVARLSRDIADAVRALASAP